MEKRKEVKVNCALLNSFLKIQPFLADHSRVLSLAASSNALKIRTAHVTGNQIDSTALCLNMTNCPC